MLRGCFLFLLSIFATACFAQDCGSLKGYVIDAQSNERLPGAGVRSTNNLLNGVNSDATGTFEHSFSKNDTLIVTFIGYEEKRIAVSSAEGCSIRIRLQPSENLIKEIEIKAERVIAEEFTIRKIRKLDIYTNPSAKADPILAANSTPSATTTDESANISLRGSSPAETGIFLNNVPINDAVRYSQLNGIGTFSIFNTALVNTVQIYPGNPPLEYGNSTSGLIALQTDEVIPGQVANTVSLTLASTGFYSTRKLTDRSSLTFFANYQPSALIRSMNSKALKDLRHFSSVDMGIHYFLKLRQGAVVKVFNYSLRESYKFRYLQPSYNGIFHQFKLRNFTVANIRRRIGNAEISFNQGLSFSKADYTYGITNINLTLQDLFSSFSIHKSGKTSEWKAGLSYDHKASVLDGNFPTYDFATAESHPVSYATSNDRVANPELYAYIKKYLGTKVIAGGGVRKNIAINDLENYISLQGNLNYKPTQNLKFNFSAGQYHKYQLPQGETSAPNLIKSKQYSLDVSYTAKQTESNLSFFYKTGIQKTSVTKISGIEIFTRAKINTNVKFQISLTSLDASRTVEGLTFPSPYNIHYFLRGNIEYKIKGTWTLTIVFLLRQGSFHYSVSGASYIDTLNVYAPVHSIQPTRLPNYNILDLSISKIFLLTERSTAVAFMSVGNIVNTPNVRDYTYNFDYTRREPYLFSRRTVYFGIVINY